MKLLPITLLSLGVSGTVWAQDDAPAESEPAAVESSEATVESPSPAEGADAAAVTTVEVELNNGIVLSGEVLTKDAISWAPGQSLSFDPDSGPKTLLQSNQIKAVRAKPEPPVQLVLPKSHLIRASEYRSPEGFDLENIGKSRHIYAPSSIGLEQGEGYFSQKLLFSAAAVGVTDNVTVLAGTFTPFPPLITVLGGKVSGEVAEDIHLAAGGEFFMTGIDSFQLLAHAAFGSVTFGSEDRQITLSSGYVGLGSEVFDSASGAIPVVVAAQVRLSRRGVFVTENWGLIIDGYEGTPVILSAAYRLLAGVRTRREGDHFVQTQPRFTWDFGLVAISDIGPDPVMVPLPWIDFAFHFGRDGN